MQCLEPDTAESLSPSQYQVRSCFVYGSGLCYLTQNARSIEELGISNDIIVGMLYKQGCHDGIYTFDSQLEVKRNRCLAESRSNHKT